MIRTRCGCVHTRHVTSTQSRHSLTATLHGGRLYVHAIHASIISQPLRKPYRQCHTRRQSYTHCLKLRVLHSTCISASEEDESDPSDSSGNIGAPPDTAAPK